MSAAAPESSALPEDALRRAPETPRALRDAPPPVGADGPLERCLEPLLRAAGWRGDQRQIVEALPHLEPLGSLNDVRLVLHRLGLSSSVDSLRPEEILDERLPALWMTDDGPLVVLARQDDGDLLVYDSERDEQRAVGVEGRRVRLCRVYSLLDGEREAAHQEEERNWLGGAIQKLGGEISFALLLTFAANLLVLTAPIYTMAAYNSVLPSKGVDTLAFLFALALAALLAESGLRRVRSNVLAAGAARINCAIITKSFDRILHLPASMVDNASVSAQAARVKQFESIVSTFSGPVLGAIFDLPFVLLFIAAIFVLGGPLALVPLAALGLFVALGLILGPAAEHASRRSAILKDRASTLTFEMLNSHGSIRELGAEAVWRRRVGEAHRRAVSAKVRSVFLEYLRSSGSLFFIGLAMVGTVCFGAVMAMQGDLTIGALVAISMLVARSLGPVQTLFMALPQVTASREAADRFRALLNLKVERAADKPPTAFRPFAGAVRFHEIAFRFPNADEFALRGLNAEIAAGEVIGMLGAGGSGRSTVLRLMLGLYRPTAGQIYIDEANLSQIHTAELRATMAYAPPAPEFFYGTVAQNLRLGRLTATDDELEEVFEALGVTLDPAFFPDGLETRLSADEFAQLPSALRQKLSLARVFVKDAAVTLLDEPLAMLEPSDQVGFWRAIDRCRGRRTMLITMSDLSAIDRCDKVMVLAKGRLAHFGEPAALRALMAERRAAS
ncbi:MAG: ABC transporter transmembrane domain-containing protein [Pseudomonadota bacterium]